MNMFAHLEVHMLPQTPSPNPVEHHPWLRIQPVHIDKLKAYVKAGYIRC